MKKPSISTVVIFLLILLGVGGLMFLKNSKEANAPTESIESSDSMMESSIEVKN
jgi:hypothetical protein